MGRDDKLHRIRPLLYVPCVCAFFFGIHILTKFFFFSFVFLSFWIMCSYI